MDLTTKKQKPEFIRASGTKGLKKSQVEVIVRTPTEKPKRVLLAEVSQLAPDKRVKKKKRYTTLFTFGKHGRTKFTYDILKGSVSLTTSLGFHFNFEVLDSFDLAKLVALVLVSKKLDTSLSYIEREGSKKLDKSFVMLVEHFIQEFQTKIKLARRSYKQHLRARDRKT